MITRREWLTTVGAAAVAPVALRGQRTPITIAGQPVEIVVRTISDSTVRITLRPIFNGAPQDVVNRGAVVEPVGAGERRVEQGNMLVSVEEGPPTIITIRRQGRIVQTLTFNNTESAVTMPIGGAPILGMGEGGPQFDRRGNDFPSRNGQGGYQLRTHGGRVPIQWLIGTDGWGVYVHQPIGSFNMNGGTITFRPTNAALPFDAFVVGSDDPKVIVGEYSRITGYAELPPLWAFGYMQSHRTLAGPEEIESVARTFREKQLPCDALIYLGTEFTPSGWNTRNGEFGWKAENFPNPKKFIDDAHARHFKVVLHIVIEGQRMAGTVADQCTPDKQVPSGRTSDDRWPADRAVPCYWPYHKPLYDLGVDGMWPDQGDGLDEPSRMARIRMYWEGPQQYRPDERPFALHRNGTPGMQRYGAFLWSGDVYSFWETLKTHVPVAVNTGLSGIPFWGTDIGGFVPTADYTGELHVRWFQFGTFCPSFRAHGRNWHLRLPWGWNTGEFGTSELRGYTGGAADPDPKELHNAAVEPIIKKYLELRYRLLPYTYTIARECCDTGLPMIRALWLHHSDDARATATGDQFLWGRDILVTPVVEKSAMVRQVYLPRGSWFDFWTEEKIDGGRVISRYVDLATMPLHVRAGAIIPMGPVKQYVDEPVDAPLAVTIYPGADGAFTLYEDDGKSFAHKRGDFMRLAMTWDDAARRFSIALAPGSRTRGSMPRRIDLRLAAASAIRSIVFDGKPQTVTL